VLDVLPHAVDRRAEDERDEGGGSPESGNRAERALHAESSGSTDGSGSDGACAPVREPIRHYRQGARYDRPMISPSGRMPRCSAAGSLGRPGMVMMSPVFATTNPAPAEPYTALMVIRNPVGRPSRLGSSVREYWVFAMHTGVAARPMDSRYSTARSAAGE